MSDAPKKLTKKLADIMAEIDHIPKRGTNTHFGYDYVKEEDVVAKIRPKLAEKGIMLYPSVVGHTREGNITTADMEFTFVDSESGESLTVKWAGEGQDKQDKGMNKAAVGAVKYFLLKTFLVPTGDDAEQDQPRDDGANNRNKANSADNRREPGRRELLMKIKKGAKHLGWKKEFVDQEFAAFSEDALGGKMTLTEAPADALDAFLRHMRAVGDDGDTYVEEAA